MQSHYVKRSEKVYKHTSRYLGVCWHNTLKKWRASISVNDRKKILGYFDDELEAARVYNDAARKLGRDTLNVLSE
jgi:hypothetical protein